LATDFANSRYFSIIYLMPGTSANVSLLIPPINKKSSSVKFNSLSIPSSPRARADLVSSGKSSGYFIKLNFCQISKDI
jgi:hypothetical protein